MNFRPSLGFYGEALHLASIKVTNKEKLKSSISINLGFCFVPWESLATKTGSSNFKGNYDMEYWFNTNSTKHKTGSFSLENVSFSQTRVALEVPIYYGMMVHKNFKFGLKFSPNVQWCAFGLSNNLKEKLLSQIITTESVKSIKYSDLSFDNLTFSALNVEESRLSNFGEDIPIPAEKFFLNYSYGITAQYKKINLACNFYNGNILTKMFLFSIGYAY
jgi:hypothetical protein